MGGAHWTGNVTTRAEFNIWADPEAAAAVLAAGFKRLVLVPLDATHKALVSREDCAALRALETPAGVTSASMIDHRISAYDKTQPMERPGAVPVHDAVCVAYLVDPGILDTRHLNVVVETEGVLSVGETTIDVAGRSRRAANAHVAFGAAKDSFCADAARDVPVAS